MVWLDARSCCAPSQMPQILQLGTPCMTSLPCMIACCATAGVWSATAAGSSSTPTQARPHRVQSAEKDSSRIPSKN
eukprot:1137855-Pelagomonas_calceolata.AAC.5